MCLMIFDVLMVQSEPFNLTTLTPGDPGNRGSRQARVAKSQALAIFRVLDNDIVARGREMGHKPEILFQRMLPLQWLRRVAKYI